MSLDDEEVVIHVAIGQALSMWGLIENELCTLCARCANPHNTAPTAHGFWKIVAFEAKLKLADAVICKSLEGRERDLQTWRSLHERLLRKSKIRNKISHGVILTVGYPKAEVFTKEMFLWPYYARDRSLGRSVVRGAGDLPNDRLYGNDIMRTAREWRAFYDEIVQFSDRTLQILLT